MTESAKANIGFGMKSVLIVLQVVLTIIGWDIRNSLKDHEGRIDELEKFQSEGNRWTAEEQRIFERHLAEQLGSIQLSLGRLEALNGHTHRDRDDAARRGQ